MPDPTLAEIERLELLSDRLTDWIETDLPLPLSADIQEATNALDSLLSLAKRAKTYREALESVRVTHTPEGRYFIHGQDPDPAFVHARAALSPQGKRNSSCNFCTRVEWAGDRL